MASMLTIHIKTALRSLKRRKYYTAIHIVGLGLAIACGLFIYRYISYHLSYDTHHQHANTTYRIVYDLHLEKTEHYGGVSYAIYQTLKNDIAGIDHAAYAMVNQDFTLRVGDRIFGSDKKGAFASSDWFALFDYHWLAGSSAGLDQPQTVALTASAAKRLFGTVDPMGKTIHVENNVPLQVVGIIDDRPSNTSLKSDYYISLPSLKTVIPGMDDQFFTFWGYLNSPNQVYVSLAGGTPPSHIEDRLQMLTNEAFGPAAGRQFQFRLQPLSTLHFDSRYGGTVQQSLLATLGIIGLGILIMALLNYVNLSLAQYARRSAEIGTRKALGGSHGQLFGQFMVESLGTAALATLLGIGLLLAALPLANKHLFAAEPLAPFPWSQLIPVAAAAWLVTGLAAGLYPAWIIGRLNILHALKQQVAFGTSGGRKTIVIIQNTLSQCLLMATLVIMLQVHYLQSTDIGFDRDSVLMIALPKGTKDPSPWKTYLDAQPAVLSYSFCFRSPANHDQRGGTLRFDDRSEWETWPARSTFADSAYLQTFGIDLLAGRNLRTDAAMAEYLVNETMVRQLGLEEPAAVVGKPLLFGGMYSEAPGVIVGVVHDYNTHSLHQTIEPTVIGYHKDRIQAIAVKLDSRQIASFIDHLEQEWKARYPAELLDYQFVDEQVEQLYAAEYVQQKLIWTASAIAVMIGCLGLLGLASLNIVQRTKEIGIRKVLGASASNIVRLLSADFVTLVGVAFLIATPITWWLMNTWLDDFAYRITIQWWVFALGGLIALTIAVATVGFQAIKAASANPAESLRDE